MASRKLDLPAEIRDIVSEAVERVKDLVKDSLSKELGSLIGSGVLAAGGPPSGRGRQAAKGAAPARARGKPGRRSSLGPEKMDALVKLVNREGEMAPMDARRELRLTTPQMQTLARNTAKLGRIKVEGQGRGTRYKRA